MFYETRNIRMTTSPILVIDDMETVIVHLNKIRSRKFEQLDIQLPGYHLLNRVGFRDAGEMREIIRFIEGHMEEIWTIAEYNTQELDESVFS